MKFAWKGSFAFAAAIAVLLGFPALTGAAPVARLTYQSDPGDYIGQGTTQDFTYTLANSTFIGANVFAIGAAPGTPAYVQFAMIGGSGPTDPPSMGANFSTRDVPAPLVPGNYLDAERASLASPGHPGLDIGGDGRGCNTITGSFIVTNATYSPDGSGGWDVQSFDASFEQHCEGGIPALRGTFSYRADATALTVAKAGAGSGTVTSSPGGIDCGTTCVEYFSTGSTVTLAAAPAPGSTFAGWSGACTGTGACVVTMDADKAVTATFVALGIAVTKAGSGSGTVTSSPAGIDCGATCSAIFSLGSSVTLNAVPAADSIFAGWGGACTGTGACVVTIDAEKAVTASFTATADVLRLTNISTRVHALTGDDVPIAGFVISGSARKAVMILARGQSMAPLGVPNTLYNPSLQLFSGQTLIASNDDWVRAPNAVAIYQSGLAPALENEAAIYQYLDPGAYTAIVRGPEGATGIAIVEVFEMGDILSPFINVATRGLVQTGDSVMIGGFIISGNAPKTVLITARGPSLAAFGITNPLANPMLQLFSSEAMIAANDDFGTATNLTQIQATGHAPANALESAILITLNPGGYTAIVSGVGGGTGVGIVEVYAQ